MMIGKTSLKKLLLLASTIGVVLVVTLFLLPQASGQPPSPQLRLHRGTFDAQDPEPFAGTQESGQPAPGPYTIIQFRGPITPADRATLKKTGVAILEYLPDYAYLVRGTDAQLAAAAALPRTYARAPFTLADKLSPSLLSAAQDGQNNVGRLKIVAWPGQDDQLARDLETLSFDVTGELSLDQLMQVANLASVRWIETVGQPRIINDYARTIMGVNSAWQSAPLFGNGQIIGVADSGLDTGILNTLSPDFAGRVLATYALADGGDWADQHGHGTHVAGSMAGAGVLSGADPAQQDYENSFAGMAPEANLVIQGFEVEGGSSIVGIPDDYYDLFNQVYTDGVRLHSNSWGDTTGPAGSPSEFGGYVDGTQRTDEFIWDHPDTTIFVAAGNNGEDYGTPVFGFCIGDGVVDPDSLLSPGTAKNVVTVGASESTRDSGPAQGYIWSLMGECFWAQPIGADPIANNANGMAAFSSRGPADDGRTKPDIVAPGINIVSSRSHDPAAGTLWGPYDANYAYSGGTSMATPLVAGMGALVREWLTLQGAINPSAALVKATLLNTTHDMAPGQYGTGSKQEIPYNRPNNVAGWGRADLGFMAASPYYRLWFDDHAAGLSTSQAVSYTHTISQPLQVLTDTMPLRIMLAWTDPPASLSSAVNLVNDLDLVVTGPGGPYYGNNVSTGDRTNNVEGIVIKNPPLGQYEVEVNAYQVPTATQPYALVIAGPLGSPGPPVITHTPVTTSLADTPLPVTATVSSDLPPLAVTLNYSSTGDTIYSSIPMVNLSGDVYSATIPAGDVLTPTLSYYIEASDTVGTVMDGPHLVMVTLPAQPPAAPLLISPTGATFSTTITYSWEEVPAANEYQLLVLDDQSNQVHNAWYQSADVCDGGTCVVTPSAPLALGSHTWYVKARNAVGGTWSQGVRFHVSAESAPAAPNLKLPSGVIDDPLPTYTWDQVGSAVEYQLLVVGNDTSQPVNAWYQSSDICNGFTCSVAQPAPLSEQRYTWYVRAKNPYGLTWSPGLIFTVFIGSRPALPSLIAPSGLINDTTPVFSWLDADDASDYKLLVVDSQHNQVHNAWYLAADICDGATCSVLQPDPLPEDDYNWYVKAWNPAGSTWSPSKRFTIFTGGPPAPPPPIAPTGPIADTTPTYSWGEAADATYYQVQVYDSTNSRVFAAWYLAADYCAAGTCMVTPGGALAPGDYRWYVRAWNPSGSAWSPATYFRIVSGP